jgi:hypothetical protein
LGVGPVGIGVDGLDMADGIDGFIGDGAFRR